MLIEYMYGIMFFVMPIVGMFVAVIVAGIKNIRSVECAGGNYNDGGCKEINNYIEYINYIKGDKTQRDIIETDKQLEEKSYIYNEECIRDMQPGVIINMNDWVKKRVMNKLSTTITNQMAITRCIGDNREFIGYNKESIDYGLASDILTVKRKKELASWLKQNKEKQLRQLKQKEKDNHLEYTTYLTRFKVFGFIKKYKFRRQRIRAGP